MGEGGGGYILTAPLASAADLGSIPVFVVGTFSGSSRTTDLKHGSPIASLPGTWHYSVSAGIGWPSVSIL